MNDPTRYGSRYWCIARRQGEPLYMHADRMEVTPSGALVAYGCFRAEGKPKTEEPYPIWAAAAGQWDAFYAANCMDGSMVCEEAHE